MATLYVDTETRSTAKLGDVGAHRYFEAGAEVILCAFAFDGEDVMVADGGKDSAYMLNCYLAQAETVVMHNAEFDSLALASMGVHVPLEKQHCTVAQAAAHGLPGGLGELSEIFLPAGEGKLEEGKALIKLFCQPDRKGQWHDSKTDPQKWMEFVQYAKRDVEAMRALYAKLPKCNWAFEKPIWLAHRKVNDHGILVDTEFCTNITALIEKEREMAAARIAELTGGRVNSPTQTAKLKAWIEAQGVSLTDMREATLEGALVMDLPAAAMEAIRIRLFCAKASSAKYIAAMDRVNEDGRLRGTLQYCGARRTGRWSGYGIQPQNFARPTLPSEHIDEFIDAVKTGCQDLVRDEDISYSDYGKQCVRGIIVAPLGQHLVVADLANIEGRVVAFLAGAEEKLQAFREYDAKVGPDLYKVAYASAFGKDVKEVTKDERSVGKVLELALGYGGGVNALLTGFKAYRVEPESIVETVLASAPSSLQASAVSTRDRAPAELLALPEDVYKACWCLTRMWRQSDLNAPIAKLWATLEAAVRDVIKDGRARRAGLLVVDRPKPSWLRIKLPSGRFLMYARPAIGEDNKVTFTGMRASGAGWGQCYTWGGTFVENCAQAFARDVLAASVADLVQLGTVTQVVLTVHDEIVCETSHSRPENVLHNMVQLMTQERPWTKGMPLAAEGFVTQRYKK